ncbi:hypothetical protein [Paenibacillus sp. 1A_MP2]|uniref:hypothetical protein n=1 Tax=Paenibacillus sp. 1A_MP2 TaxID=3457495 RepID=UPI003FCD7D44
MSTIVAEELQDWCVNTSWLDQARYVHRELLKYQYESHLTERTQPNINRVFSNQNNYGWTALAFDVAGMSLKPKTARSFPSLFNKIEKEGYQYYRPNLSYTSQSHAKRKLRWLVSIIMDFDAEHLKDLGIEDHEQLIRHVEDHGFEVFGVIKTTSGYHVYLPMQPLRGQYNGNRTIIRYDQTLKYITRMLGADMNAASAEHYFRTPQQYNVVYFKPVPKPDFSFYEQLFIESIKKETKSIVEVVDSQPNFGKIMKQPAIVKLYSGNFIEKAYTDGKAGRKKVGRNNAAFTLALAMKADGWNKEEAVMGLKDWFHKRLNNKSGFTWAEVGRAIEHAYCKDYKGPSPVYVEALTGLKFRPLTERVSEQDRKKMTYKSIEEKIVSYLRRYYQEFEKDLMLSQAKLAEELRVNLRSLQYVLKSMKSRDVICIETKRVGRSNVSIYFLDSELLKQTDGENLTEGISTSVTEEFFERSPDGQSSQNGVTDGPGASESILAHGHSCHNADPSYLFFSYWSTGFSIFEREFYFQSYDWWRRCFGWGAPPGRPKLYPLA